jgi:hypothetical protein
LGRDSEVRDTWVPNLVIKSLPRRRVGQLRITGKEWIKT